MDEDFFELLREEMDSVVQSHQQKLAKMRTGRAALAMLDGIKVEYYGSPTALNQVATLAIPEPRMISISPWDKSVIPLIEKALLKSDLGLNPSSDGALIRLHIPELTGDRRKELVRQVKKMAEDARIGIRAKRRTYLEEVKQMAKDKEISEDEERRYQTEIQTVTDGFVASADKASAAKQKEIQET